MDLNADSSIWADKVCKQNIIYISSGSSVYNLGVNLKKLDKFWIQMLKSFFS